MSDKCEVCELEAKHRHFDAIVCKACAAFFRRSVARQKAYRCGVDGKCDVDGSKLMKYTYFLKAGLICSSVENSSEF